MNPRQWKKACKKAAAELERRWPGQHEFVLSDGMDTVYAPPRYEPRHRLPGAWRRHYASPPKGTPIIVKRDYYGEVDIITALDALRYMQMVEDTDWDAEWKKMAEENAKADPSTAPWAVSNQTKGSLLCGE